MNRLLRSTPLRLSLALVALFSVVSLASLAVSFAVARATIETTIRETLVRDLAGFRAAPSARAVAALVEAQGRVMAPSNRIIGYRDPSGRLYGNGTIVRTEVGFAAVALDSADNVAENYFALTEVVHGGFLTLGASTDARNTLRETMTTVLWVSLLPTVIIALGGGLLIARRSERRLFALEGTLGKLTSGDLTARVPELPGAADDLTRIAGRIDAMAIAQEEKVEVLRQVSADIAHDLKTPIQRVAVLLDQARSAEGEETKGLIEDAGAETQSIVKIFDALLQIAQMEGRAAAPDFGEFGLAGLAEDLVDLYVPSAEEAGQRLTLSIAHAGEIRGDRTLVGQLLANLIENGLRHAGEGACVEVTVDGPVLTVADNGPGIPIEERELVLRRLYRREASRTTPGSGLGLALVKAIARLHQAELILEDNNPGLAVLVTFEQAG